jgi:hypothetical protein
MRLKKLAGIVFTVLVAIAATAFFVTWPPSASKASQTETQTISIDATTCVQTLGGTLTRDNNSVQSASSAAWTLRCPIDPIDSSLGAATITGVSAFGKALGDFASSVTVAVFNRSTVADTTRASACSCAILPNPGVPTSCTSAAVTHAVIDNTNGYYVEFAVPAGSGNLWEMSGARVTYTWVNGP